MMIVSERKNLPELLYAMRVHYTKPRGTPPGQIITFVFRRDLEAAEAVLSYCWPPKLCILRTLFGNDLIGKVWNNWLFHKFPVAVKPASWYLAKTVRWLFRHGAEGVMTFVPVSRAGTCYKAAGWEEVGMTRGLTVRFKRRGRWEGVDAVRVESVERKRIFVRFKKRRR